MPPPQSRPGDLPTSEAAGAKIALRDQIRTSRNRLNVAELGELGRGLAEVVTSHPDVRRAATVTAYVSVGTEPPTGTLLEALSALGKRVILPAVQRDMDLDWGTWRGSTSLAPARYGLLEPVDRLGLDAIATADVVSLGPGSWFTSVLPHLLVPRLRKALETSRARVVVVLNLEPQAGETDGFSPEEHLRVLQAHLGGVALHTVIADAESVVDRHGLLTAVRACGAELVLAPVAEPDGAPRHDPERLSAALASVAGAR